MDRARNYIQSLGLYGKISVDTFDGKQLPFVDNLVNLVVAERLDGVSMDGVSMDGVSMDGVSMDGVSMDGVSMDGVSMDGVSMDGVSMDGVSMDGVSMDEVMRVLAPGGVAYIKGDTSWNKTVKPRPDDIDHWTHFLHGPDNNAVAEDLVVGPPRHMQWLAGPRLDAASPFRQRHRSGDQGRRFFPADGFTTQSTRPSRRICGCRAGGSWRPATPLAACCSGRCRFETAGYERRLERRLARIHRRCSVESTPNSGPISPLSELDGRHRQGDRELSRGPKDLSEAIKYEKTACSW